MLKREKRETLLIQITNMVMESHSIRNMITNTQKKKPNKKIIKKNTTSQRMKRKMPKIKQKPR
jgi:hypothetical protein